MHYNTAHVDARLTSVFLSVVVPAYNEVDRIGGTVRRILSFLASRPYSSELIVVLDGGRPGAAEAIARALSADRNGSSQVSVLDNAQNRGKGFSVRRGVLSSRGEYILFADADLSLPIEAADQFINALQDGYDVAIGSRAVQGAMERGERQMLRHALGRLFNWIVQRAFVTGIQDTQCGFKAFRGLVARDLFAAQRIEGFGFDVELLTLARQRGYRIVELPVTCEYHASTSVSRIRHGAAMLVDLATISWNVRRGRYDA